MSAEDHTFEAAWEEANLDLPPEDSALTDQAV